MSMAFIIVLPYQIQEHRPLFPQERTTSTQTLSMPESPEMVLDDTIYPGMIRYH
jgi:hypothetical protein